MHISNPTQVRGRFVPDSRRTGRMIDQSGFDLGYVTLEKDVFPGFYNSATDVQNFGRKIGTMKRKPAAKE